MAAQKGRAALLKISDGTSPGTFTTIGGMRSKTFTINNSSVDITDADSDGWRELLGDAGDRTVSVSGSGVFKDDAALNTVEDLVFQDTLREFQLIWGNGDIIQGLFQITSYEAGGEHNAEQTFSISLESAGEIMLIRA